jgi:hypothetical protein
MLNLLTATDTDTTTHAPPLLADPETPRAPLSEADARDVLTAFKTAGTERPSLRQLATAWCWSKSKVDRLVSRFDAETGGETPPGTPAVVSPPAPTPDATDDFDWRTDDAVVLRSQPATAIFFNRDDDLIIRQQCDHDDDVAVIVTKQNVSAFLDALTDALGIPAFGGPEPRSGGR